MWGNYGDRATFAITLVVRFVPLISLWRIVVGQQIVRRVAQFTLLLLPYRRQVLQVLQNI